MRSRIRIRCLHYQQVTCVPESTVANASVLGNCFGADYDPSEPDDQNYMQLLREKGLDGYDPCFSRSWRHLTLTIDRRDQPAAAKYA
jgi:hypothetical protein